MATIPVVCPILSDGSRVKTEMIGMGTDAFIIYNDSSTVLKIPRRTARILPDGTMVRKPDDPDETDQSNEKAIYARLDGVPGIARYLVATDDGLLLQYYEKGCLEKYMEHNPVPPAWSQRMKWILQTIDVYAACHAKKVLVFDIALRNLLLADDNTVRAIDFANSSLGTLEETGELKDAKGYTAMVDVLHVTNVIYSLSTWRKFQMDCYYMEEWPKAEELPSTLDLPLGNVIARSWCREYKSLIELRYAVVSSIPDELATTWSKTLV
jgi:serine/threonine protein kinase